MTSERVIKDAPVPVRYWHSWNDSGEYMCGRVKTPTANDVCRWFRAGYRGAVKVELSNGQAVIVRAKK